MKTPNNRAGELTENIMLKIAQYITDGDYNKVYGRIYTELENANTGTEIATISDMKKYIKQNKLKP